MAENSHLYPSPRPKQDGSRGAAHWVVFILAGGLAEYFFAYFELTVLNLLVMLLMARVQAT